MSSLDSWGNLSDRRFLRDRRRDFCCLQKPEVWISRFLAGVTSTYSINESSGITVDVLYSGEGFKIGKEEMNLNYLRIPVLYNVFFGQLGESFRPKVFAGPQAGFLLSAKAGGMDFKNEIKNFAFGK